MFTCLKRSSVWELKAVGVCCSQGKFLSTTSLKKIDTFFDTFNTFIANFDFQIFASSVEA